MGHGLADDSYIYGGRLRDRAYRSWSIKNSSKTETGALESKAGWKGLCRKGMTLLIILVASQLDKVAGTEVIRNAVIIGYIANEALSIIENAGLMGLPVPKFIINALIWKKKVRKVIDGLKLPESDVPD